jgi:hypothetical protein
LHQRQCDQLRERYKRKRNVIEAQLGGIQREPPAGHGAAGRIVAISLDFADNYVRRFGGSGRGGPFYKFMKNNTIYWLGSQRIFSYQNNSSLF